MTNENQLLSDQSVAKLLDVSLAWVRMQKHCRKHGKEHSLDVDPILMGKTKRYRKSDIEAWIARKEYDLPDV
jgi:hypothetical protein